MLKKFLIVCCACLALCPLPKAPAQYARVGVDGPIPLGKLDAMENMLDLADAHQKADLLTRLGVDPAIAKAAAEQLMPGKKIELQPIRAEVEAHYGVAFLPSGTGTECFLYLLLETEDFAGKVAWHVIDQQQLNCWHGSCSFEIMPLRRLDADDLVFHGVNENHGSRVVGDQTQVFSVLSGKLLQTLTTQDFLSETTWGTDKTLEQKSTFLRFPDHPLEETRTSAINGKLNKVERRYWRWSEQKRRFVAGPFMTVVAPRI
jgi:hypothetical protein